MSRVDFMTEGKDGWVFEELQRIQRVGNQGEITLSVKLGAIVRRSQQIGADVRLVFIVALM